MKRIILVVLFLGIPLVGPRAALADTCAQCLQGCNDRDKDKRKACNLEPPGQAQQACNAEADYLYKSCVLDCKSTHDDCDGGGGGCTQPTWSQPGTDTDYQYYCKVNQPAAYDTVGMGG